jgi:hypothetical protein
VGGGPQALIVGRAALLQAFAHQDRAHDAARRAACGAAPRAGRAARGHQGLDRRHVADDQQSIYISDLPPFKVSSASDRVYIDVDYRVGLGCGADHYI